MVKSTITPEQKVPKIEFPKLMVSDSYIILMEGIEKSNGNGRGTIIAALGIDGEKFVGSYHTNWLMKYFTDFTGSISLSNNPYTQTIIK
jgi:hypothetical protein